MSKIVFWSPVHGQVGTTSNMLACAANCALENDKTVLMSHTHFTLSCLESSFLPEAQLDDNSMFTFTDAGLDAVERLARSRRLTIENFSDYTTPILKERLDLLIGTAKPDLTMYEHIEDVIQSIFMKASQCYDLTFIDVNSGTQNRITHAMLDAADYVVVNLNQNVRVLDAFFNQNAWPEALHHKPYLILIGNYDPTSKYSASNLKRKYKPTVPLLPVPHCTDFMDACNSSRAMEFFMRIRHPQDKGRNAAFQSALHTIGKTIGDELKRLERLRIEKGA